MNSILQKASSSLTLSFLWEQDQVLKCPPFREWISDDQNKGNKEEEEISQGAADLEFPLSQIRDSASSSFGQSLFLQSKVLLVPSASKPAV